MCLFSQRFALQNQSIEGKHSDLSASVANRLHSLIRAKTSDEIFTEKLKIIFSAI